MAGVERNQPVTSTKDPNDRPAGTYYENNRSFGDARQLNGDYRRPAGTAAPSNVRRVWSNNTASGSSMQINGDCWDADFFHRR
ncbi:hypothetical protein I316_07398 [Kwoniella heveanensis BCC8398]|uniref:Uncharacterized protein n=1 Tax=Kwoniella heveanensis BCC8398 TaxID=1296120 RepID=A0A1B9GJ34_9TREE|nr:hypothetical protein I316_07398 [Kwoniella heveanensis BCC8398]